jgi:hypothetical protein
MQIILNKTPHFLVILMLFVVACSDNDGPAGPDNDPPEIPILEFKGPGTQTQDEGYYYINSFVNMINGTNQMGLLFMALPATRGEGGEWIWSFTIDGITSALRAEYNNDGSITWKLTYNGTDSFGYTYNNWTAIEGTSTQDGNNGMLVIYQDNTTIPASRSEWNVDNAGTKTGVYTGYTSQTGIEEFRMRIINAANDAGSFNSEDYDNGSYNLNFESEWDASGAGWWKMYDSNGELSQEGTWL